MNRILQILAVCLSFGALLQADQQVVQIYASSSGNLNASNCCSMSYMGSVDPATISMRNCQSVYMSCIGSRRAGVWQFDLSSIPKDATLLSARFKGTRSEVYMTGSGFLRMSFDDGPLNSSVCLALWNAGGWQSNTYWPNGHDFNFNVTAGIGQQFGVASTVSLLGYCGVSSSVVITNTGVSAPILELTIDVPETSPCEGDVNGDAVVDAMDVALVLGYWGRDFAECDLDQDGNVGPEDLAIVLGWWGACGG